MYVILNENSIKVNNLTKNADKLLVVFDNNIMLFNLADFMDKASKGEPSYQAMDETFRDVRIEKENKVLAIKEFSNVLQTKFGLTENDYTVLSDLLWIDNGLNLNVRVVIPQYVVFNNPNYLGLVSHVKGLTEVNRAVYYVKDGLIYVYFVELLPEHESLLSLDNNVLIEYKS